MVAGEDLPGLAGVIVEDDEVLDEVDEIALAAHALQHRFHVDHAGLLFVQALPFVEVLPAAGDGADPRLLAVGEHHHRVVVEEAGDGVAVVRVVVLEGGLQATMDVLAFDEEQRQAVDEADEVRPAAVEVAADPQLAHAEEVVVLRCLEVQDPEPFPHPFAPVVAEGDRHAVAYQHDWTGFCPVWTRCQGRSRYTANRPEFPRTPVLYGNMMKIKPIGYTRR